MRLDSVQEHELCNLMEVLPDDREKPQQKKSLKQIRDLHIQVDGYKTLQFPDFKAKENTPGC